MHFFDILNTAFKIKKRGLTPASRHGRGNVFKISGPPFLGAAPQCVQNPPAPSRAEKPPRGGHAPIAPGAYFPAFAALAALALARAAAAFSAFARAAALWASLAGVA